MLRVLITVAGLAGAVVAQLGQGADGNPHGWDRVRRCDQQDYDPPCGPCEGVGGSVTGSGQEEFTPTTCNILEASPDPVRPVWGTQWTLPLAYEIMIGKKLESDPLCFQGFPGADSIGELCYRKQTGSKVYDMLEARAFREDLELETVIGNISAVIYHQGENFWVVNHFPWYAGGIHQCICTTIRENGEQGTKHYYPVQYNWVDKMVYVGRENIGVEWLGVERELEHFAFGPHHLWSEPDTGNIIRMWQPFNGLQVYPGGVGQGPVDPALFEDIPPKLCKAGWGGAVMRIGCDDEGRPQTGRAAPPPPPSPRHPATGRDHARAKEKVPRDHYKGADFAEMSDVLNGWLNSSELTKPCLDWSVEELQQLQGLLLLARESQFDTIYSATRDNRRLRAEVLADLAENWAGLNSLAARHPDPRLARVRRDGHCHEAVMWYVHHLTEDTKQLLRSAKIPLPLLSPARHGICSSSDLDPAGHRICGAYREQVTCASCHSNETPPDH